jgi:hypothetical protein
MEQAKHCGSMQMRTSTLDHDDIFTLNYNAAVLGIRMIRRFLGFPDPDLLIRGMDPDPHPSLFSSRCGAYEIILKNKILTQNFSKKINF